MLTTEHPWTDTATCLASPEGYALRIDGGTQDERLIAIPYGKHSLGSGPRCALRLQYPGVQPLSCLIVHDDDGLRVRRWSHDALVNGQEFNELTLEAGDVLSLGPVELEIVTPGSPRASEELEDTDQIASSVGEPEGGHCETQEQADAGDNRDAAAGNETTLTTETTTDTTTDATDEAEFSPWAASEWQVDEAEQLLSAELARVWEGSELPTEEPPIDSLAPVEVTTVESPEASASEAGEVVAAPANPERRIARSIARRRGRRVLRALRQQRDDYAALVARVGELEQKIALASVLPTAPVPPVEPAASAATSLRDAEALARQEALEAELTSLHEQLAAREAELAEARTAIDALERQLSDSQHTMNAFADERDEWEKQFSQLESRLAEYVDRIQELERHLLLVQTVQTAPAVPTADANAATGADVAADAATRNATASDTSLACSPQSAESDARESSAIPASIAEVTACQEPASSRETTDELTKQESYSIGSPPAAAEVMPAAAPVVAAEPASVESSVPAPAAPLAAQPSAPATPVEDEVAVDEALDHLRELSIWRQEPNATPEAATPPAAATVPTPAKCERQVESFIDRYAHLLPKEDEVAAAPIQPPMPHPAAARPAPRDDENEGSIEEYMSQLMARMRGATLGRSPSEPAASSAPANCELPAAESIAPEPIDMTPLANLDELKPHATAPERARDLAAMRALANQTARQAIGVHAAYKLRRSARTRLIVTLLGAAVGLYLLIDAPNWKSLQFAAGCLATITALYWGRLTLAAFIKGIQTGAFEPIECEVDLEKAVHPPLPIDLEPTRPNEPSQPTYPGAHV